MRLAHSLILHKHFHQPTKAMNLGNGGDSRQSAGWESALGEPFQIAILRLIEEGYLQRSEMILPLPRLLEFSFSAAELKSILQGHGLRLSGRKAELASRLAEGNRDAALDALNAKCYYSRTKMGDELAEQFTTREESASEIALLKFRQGDYSGAIRTAQAFDTDLGFPASPFFNQILPEQCFRYLACARPVILESLPDHVIEELRDEVVLSWLGLGSTQPRLEKWQPCDGVTFRLERQFARNMLWFSAKLRYDLEQLVKAGRKRVRISAASDSCADCASVNNTEWDIGSVPELPHPNCTHHYGCRCGWRGWWTA
ncbi:MAG: SAP domain-containing protein [Terracidiphilus sp.]